MNSSSFEPPPKIEIQVTMADILLAMGIRNAVTTIQKIGVDIPNQSISNAYKTTHSCPLAIATNRSLQTHIAPEPRCISTASAYPDIIHIWFKSSTNTAQRYRYQCCENGGYIMRTFDRVTQTFIQPRRPIKVTLTLNDPHLTLEGLTK